MSTGDAWLAIERVDVEVGPKRYPAVSFHALTRRTDALGDGCFEIVVADLAGGHSAEDFEGVYATLEECFLPAGCGDTVNSFAGIRHPQREQVTGHQFSAQPYADFTEIHLSLSAGQVAWP